MLKIVIFCIVARGLCAGFTIPDKFIKNNNDFSISLYKELLKYQNGSFVFGIFPTQAVLALLASGAQGGTAREIKSVAGLNGLDQDVTDVFRQTLQELNGPHFKAILSDKICVNNELHINSSFQTEASNFGTTIKKVDLKSNDKIIEDFSYILDYAMKYAIGIARSMIAVVSKTKVNGSWMHRWMDRQSTKEMDFHKSATESIKANMMKTTGYFMISRRPDLGMNMVKLPFKNEKAYMLLILTDDIQSLNNIADNAYKLWTGRIFTKEYMTIYLPKFKISSDLDLKKSLKNMGISNLFESADLSGINEEIRQVPIFYQKVEVDVDERGVSTENSTLVANNSIAKESDTSEEPKVFKVDHPFAFGIFYDDISLVFGNVYDV